jgi:hypothetical protein
MYYYIYYGYLAYGMVRYAYLLDYGYVSLCYANKLRHWVFDKPKPTREERIEEDWILCNLKEPDVIVMD